MKSQQLRCLLKNFYSSLNSYLYNHQGNHSEKILHELELIKLDSIEKINASKSATCSELNNTLRNIPVKLAPLDCRMGPSTFADMLEQAQEADRLGYLGVTIQEHHPIKFDSLGEV